jgi:hypothetical protein
MAAGSGFRSRRVCRARSASQWAPWASAACRDGFEFCGGVFWITACSECCADEDAHAEFVDHHARFLSLPNILKITNGIQNVCRIRFMSFQTRLSRRGGGFGIGLAVI